MAQRFHIVGLDFPAVQQHRAFGGVIQPGNQVHQSGLAGTGAADDADGLARLGPEGDMLQRGAGRACVAGSHVPELHLAGEGAGGGASVFLIAFQIQHSGETVAAGNGLGQRDDQVCHFDQFHQDLRHIVIQGDHQALGEDAMLHLHRAHIHQNHHCQVDDHISHRVHQSGDAACGKLAGGEFLRLLFKALHLRVLLAEGTEHPDACQILPGGRGHAVQRSLDPLMHGHGDQHDAEHDQAQHGNDPGKHQCRLEINGEGHNHGAKHHEGRTQQQPQGQVDTVLHLVDIRSHPGDHGGGAQLIDLAVAQMQNMLHEHMAQSGGEAHRRNCGKILGADSHDKANDTQSHHDQAHFDDIPGIAAADAPVHDPRHHQRNQQFKGCLQQLKQRAENALFFVTFQVFQEFFHVHHLITRKLYHFLPRFAMVRAKRNARRMVPPCVFSLLCKFGRSPHQCAHWLAMTYSF